MATRAPRGVSAAVKLNKAALNDVTYAVADGAMEALRVIVEIASSEAPDSPYDPYPTGEGLPKQGGVLVYVGGKKVDGWSLRGVQPKKPKSIRQAVKEHSVLAIAGFGFPGRFAHEGTIRHPGDPFFLRAFQRVGVQGVINIIGDVTRPILRRHP